jgi:hypothetical protein
MPQSQEKKKTTAVNPSLTLTRHKNTYLLSLKDDYEADSRWATHELSPAEMVSLHTELSESFVAWGEEIIQNPENKLSFDQLDKFAELKCALEQVEHLAFELLNLFGVKESFSYEREKLQ